MMTTLYTTTLWLDLQEEDDEWEEDEELDDDDEWEEDEELDDDDEWDEEQAKERTGCDTLLSSGPPLPRWANLGNL